MSKITSVSVSWDYINNHNEMKMKVKNRSHRYKINRLRSRYGYKYIKYKKFSTQTIHLNLNTRVSFTEHFANFLEQTWIRGVSKDIHVHNAVFKSTEILYCRNIWDFSRILLSRYCRLKLMPVWKFQNDPNYLIPFCKV